MSEKIYITPVILCGGSGTRLWPMSRASFPKQFLTLSGSLSLFQNTLNRFNNFISSKISKNDPIIVTNEAHRFLVLDQIGALPDFSFSLITEPFGRNTAPALTLAALSATENNQDPILIVAPSDHIIKDESAFGFAIANAIAVAKENSIVVLGAPPSTPDSNFGYIKCAGLPGKNQEYSVTKFVEKPSLSNAIAFVSDQQYTWNSGIVVLRASVWLKAIEYFRPKIFKSSCLAFVSKKQKNYISRFDTKFFSQIPSESIDYAVLEHCPDSPFHIKMIQLNAGWSDLGMWEKVLEISNKDFHGNSVKGDVIVKNVYDSLVIANYRLVNVLGVKNLIVIETADSIFIADRNHSHQINFIIDQLRNENRDELSLHRKVARPWGWYDILESGENFKVKLIQVKPRASLSLQSHSKRSEHWVVIKGTAEIICDEVQTILNKNESTFIPVGKKHRLSNPSDETLEIIEVQSGESVSEDDIIRYDDKYDRVEKAKKK